MDSVSEDVVILTSGIKISSLHTVLRYTTPTNAVATETHAMHFKRQRSELRANTVRYNQTLSMILCFHFPAITQQAVIISGYSAVFLVLVIRDTYETGRFRFFPGC